MIKESSYICIQSTNYDTFINEVNSAISRGYVTAGGVSTATRAEVTIVYTQALVKREKVNEYKF